MKRRQVFRAQASKTQSSSSVRRFTNSGPVLPFNPASIAGCQLWLDAADTSSILLSGSSNVSLWIDKSGNGNTVTQDTSANQPTYVTNVVNGNPVIRFNGTSHVLQTTSFTSLGTNSVSFWLVERNLSNSGGGGAPFSFNSGPNNGIVFQNNNGLQPLPNSVPYTSSVARIIFYNRTNTGSGDSTYLNGTVVTTRDDNTTGTYGTTFAVGMRILSTIYTSGDICEILIFIGMPTTTQRQKVEGYLANKWGLQSSLPSNHPYKSIAPTYEEPVFVPTLILGNQLWLDGADPSGNAIIPSIGGNVSTWTDKSGNGLNGTATGTIPIFASGGGITFSAGAYNTSYSSSLTNECLFVVFRYTRTSGTLSLVGQTGDGARLLSLGAGASTAQLQSSVYNVALGALSPNTTVPINTIGLGELFTTNSSMDIFYNGTSVGTPTAVTITSGRTSIIGGASTGGSINTSQYFGGTIHEVIGFTGQLTTSQIRRVEGYLAQKWGLQSSLPENHPYKTIAPTGIPRSITIQSVSALFTASNNSSLSIPASSVLTLGTNDHTIEFWIYQTSRNQYAVPFIYGNTTSTATNNYYMDGGSDYLGFVIGNGSGGWAVNINGGTVPNLNTWNHYAIVRNGTTFTFYVNGISRASATSSINIPAQGDVFKIGNSTIYPINGYISNFRLVNGTAVYTSNFTPPTSPLTAIPNTQILIQGLVDRSPNAFTVTNNGSVALSTTISPFV